MSNTQDVRKCQIEPSVFSAHHILHGDSLFSFQGLWNHAYKNKRGIYKILQEWEENYKEKPLKITHKETLN